MKPQKVYDIEIFPGYFLVAFKCLKTAKVELFEMYDGKSFDRAAVLQVITTAEIIGFNSNNFDTPLLSLAMKRGTTVAQLKEAANAIINENLRPWQFSSRFNVSILELDTVDLIEVAPGMASLKIYGGRMHCPKLQDLPFEPEDTILPQHREMLRTYCVNDLDTTIALYRQLAPQIDLRRKMSLQYDQDLRSKSDAQIAEAVIRSQIATITGTALGKPSIKWDAGYKYKRPSFIRFESEVLQEVLAMVKAIEFSTGPGGKIEMPDALTKAKITIGESSYKMGIGGLHSTESCVTHKSDTDTVILDRDVASYYPAIILNCGLYPKHLGRTFMTVYRAIVDRRLAAKRTGDKVTADALKITINGSFGKFGNKYSALFSPDLLLQTTITGQLALLMLIEQVEAQGIAVVSANTDGVVMRVPRVKLALLNDTIACWEFATGFETEETRYNALYSRDVNSYIAVKADGGIKTKGAYAGSSLAKAPTMEISIDAAIAYLVNGTPIETTVEMCVDIRKFVTVRRVNGGAVWRGQKLGKAVRFYYAAGSTDAIHYCTNGNKVSMSQGAMPAMDLPALLPDDIDYDLYINKAYEILAEIGATQLETA